MKIKLLLLILWVLSVNPAFAQSSKRRVSIERQLREIQHEFEDSLNLVVAKYATDTLERRIRLNPRFYRLFCPPTLYSSSISNSLTMGDYKELFPTKEKSYLVLSNGSIINKNQEIETEIDKVLLDTYLAYPEYINYTQEQIMSNYGVKSEAILDLQPTANIISHILPPEKNVENVTGTKLVIKKPNFWTTSGSMSVQFTQNYISGNWYKGGESTNTLVSGFALEANYNDKQRIQFDNKLELKLGFTTAPSDTLHEYRTNTDVLRLASKLGLKAISSWYYTIGVDINTQMLRNYKVNSNVLQSAFLAPLKVSFNIGMDYKKNGKKYTVSTTLSPLAYQWTYIGNSKVNETNFGVDAGKRSLHDFGSSMKVTSKWTIFSNIVWESRLDAFTNYEKVEASWENTINFAISKYLSTQLFMHGRFDDGVKRKSGYDYFQFKEFLSIGFKYNW